MFGSVSFNGDPLGDGMIDDVDGSLMVEFDWDSERVQYRCRWCDAVFADEDAAEGDSCLEAECSKGHDCDEVEEPDEEECWFAHDLVEEDEPLSWVNSAGIHIDEEADQVDVTVSVGDPRGAFVMRLYRAEDGKVRMEVPHPEQGFLHEPLREINPRGVYEVGR